MDAIAEGSNLLLEFGGLGGQRCLGDHVSRNERLGRLDLGGSCELVSQRAGVACVLLLPEVSLGGHELLLELTNCLRRSVDTDFDEVSVAGVEDASQYRLNASGQGPRVHQELESFLLGGRCDDGRSGAKGLGGGLAAVALGVGARRERDEGIAVVDDLGDRLEAGGHDVVVERGVTFETEDSSGDLVAGVVDLSGYLCLAGGCAECCHDVLLGDSCCVGCI